MEVDNIYDGRVSQIKKPAKGSWHESLPALHQSRGDRPLERSASCNGKRRF